METTITSATKHISTRFIVGMCDSIVSPIIYHHSDHTLESCSFDKMFTKKKIRILLLLPKQKYAVRYTQGVLRERLQPPHQ